MGVIFELVHWIGGGKSSGESGSMVINKIVSIC